MLGDKVGEKLFKKLGDFAGPLGSLIGGALGGLFGGLFKKTTSGAVSLGVNQFGAAGISNTIGNSAAIQKEATGYGGAVAGSLNRIAEALGATVGDFSVAIGKRSSGWIKVSASGNAQATTGKKVTSDIIYNGKDEAEAIRAALLNAIQDGAIKGIREGAQRLLKAGSDIEAHQGPREMAEAALEGLLTKGGPERLLNWRASHPVAPELVDLLASVTGKGDAVRAAALSEVPLR